MTDLKQRQEEFLSTIVTKEYRGSARESRYPNLKIYSFHFVDGFDAYESSPIFLAMKAALERLASSEAFHVALPNIPTEVKMRMDFARSVLSQLTESEGES